MQVGNKGRRRKGLAFHDWPSVLHSRETFSGIRSWLADVRQLANPEMVLILCGNKTDKGEEREVSYLEASRFAQEQGKKTSRSRTVNLSLPTVIIEMMFLEASAFSGDGVEEMFFKCTRTILSKIETGQIDPERGGSGVQFGDSSLRRMAQRTRTKKKDRSCCFSWSTLSIMYSSSVLLVTIIPYPPYLYSTWQTILFV